MKKYMSLMLICFLCFTFIGNAFASNTDDALNAATRNLSEQDKAALLAKAAEMTKNTPVTNLIEKSSPTKVNEWVEVGKNAGQAIIALAGELGVAADKILDSKTGTIAMALVIWKVMGHDIAGIVIGFTTLIIFLTGWVYYFRRMCVIKNVLITYPSKEGKNANISKQKEYVYYEPGKVDGTRLIFVVVLILGVIFNFMIMFK